MATDLTTTLKEIFTSTVETGLSKEITLNDCFTSSLQVVKNKKILSIDSLFAFDGKILTITYLLELPIASLILHSMMFEEYALEMELSEDIIDASKEFISQVSGALETAINGAGFEDIANTKFSIGETKAFNEDELETENSIFRLNLTVEEKPFDLFISLKDEDKTLFEELIASKQDSLISEENSSDNTQEDTSTDEEEDLTIIPDELIDALEGHTEDKEENIEDINEEETKEELSENEESKEENEELSNEVKEVTQDDNDDTQAEEPLDEDEKKQKKLKLIIIILGSVIGVLILAFIIMYFMGIFDNPEPLPVDNNATKIVKPSKESMIIASIKNKQIEYNDKLINKKRLNKKLALLTKYEILDDDVVTKFQQEEKERLYKIKMQQLEEFAKNNKEESIFKTTLNKNISNKESRFIDINDSNKTNNSNLAFENPNEKLIFIKIDPIEYKNFKDIIKAEKTSTTSISMCKNNKGKIDIYVGPMYINLETNNIIKRVRKTFPDKKSSISITKLLRKEFNNLCNF